MSIVGFWESSSDDSATEDSKQSEDNDQTNNRDDNVNGVTVARAYKNENGVNSASDNKNCNMQILSKENCEKNNFNANQFETDTHSNQVLQYIIVLENII